MRTTTVFLASGLLIASGCGTTNPLHNTLLAQQDRAAVEGAKQPQGTRQDELNAISEDYKAAFDSCVTKMEELRGGLKKASKTSVSIATVGIIAGSIIVPALAAKAIVAKSTVAAWGGVSGAANAAQSMLDSSGLSPNDALHTYSAARSGMVAATTNFNNATEPAAKRNAVMQLWMACNVPDLSGTVSNVQIPAAGSGAPDPAAGEEPKPGTASGEAAPKDTGK